MCFIYHIHSTEEILYSPYGKSLTYFPQILILKVFISIFLATHRQSNIMLLGVLFVWFCFDSSNIYVIW